MPGITVKGEKQNYLFSVVEADYDNMPDWGGVYIAVRATTMGIRIEDCVAIGSCSNFKKYAEKIRNFTEDMCTHIYLMPEFEMQKRKIALSDLMRTEAFAGVMLRTLELSTKDAGPEGNQPFTF